MKAPRNGSTGPQRADIVLTLTCSEVRELVERLNRTSGYAPVIGRQAHGTSLDRKIEEAARCAA